VLGNACGEMDLRRQGPACMVSLREITGRGMLPWDGYIQTPPLWLFSLARFGFPASGLSRGGITPSALFFIVPI
jgi:hypothetical protein